MITRVALIAAMIGTIIVLEGSDPIVSVQSLRPACPRMATGVDSVQSPLPPRPRVALSHTAIGATLSHNAPSYEVGG